MTEEVERLEPRDEHKVFSMSLRGYSNDEIATFLNVSNNSVRRVLANRKKLIAEKLETINQADYIGLVQARYDEIRIRASEQYEISQSPLDKARFLKIEMELLRQEVATLQSLGALKRAPEEQKVVGELSATVGHMALPANLDPAQMEALAATLLASTMKVSPEEVMRMGGRLGEIPTEKMLKPYIDAEFEEVSPSKPSIAASATTTDISDGANEYDDHDEYEDDEEAVEQLAPPMRVIRIENDAPASKKPVKESIDFNFDLD